jgi:cobalt-zinc-cadmium efflux system outer membrane protein
MINYTFSQVFCMRRSIRLLAIAAFGLLFTVVPGQVFSQNLSFTQGETKGSLSLTDALQKVQSSPAIKAASKSVEIKAGFAKQAGLFPNPQLAVEVENFGGKDNLKGLDGAEITVALNQLIEIGGKRSARKSVAGHDLKLAEWDYQSKKQDLQLATMKAFYAVLTAQERLGQANQLLSLAEQGYQTVADRVEAGKVSPVQKLRASVELNMARNRFESAKRQRIQARYILASKWGDSAPGFDTVVGVFDQLNEPPEWDALQTDFLNNSDVQRWQSELANKKAALDLARAGIIPDVTLIFGVRKFKETNANALVAGLEFPLPFFDRNQGRRMAAQAQVSQSIYRRDAAIAELTSGLQSAYQELLVAHYQARSIQQEIMPAAQQANEAAQIGYREGKFDFLDALDAQRTLFEVKAEYINAFSAYHAARFDVMRMTGRIGDGQQIN